MDSGAKDKERLNEIQPMGLLDMIDDETYLPIETWPVARAFLHPHENCPHCAAARGVGSATLDLATMTKWLLDNHSEAKQVIAARLLHAFNISERKETV